MVLSVKVPFKNITSVLSAMNDPLVVDELLMYQSRVWQGEAFTGHSDSSPGVT